jgi:hypothetical protein
MSIQFLDHYLEWRQVDHSEPDYEKLRCSGKMGYVLAMSSKKCNRSRFPKVVMALTSRFDDHILTSLKATTTFLRFGKALKLKI